MGNLGYSYSPVHPGELLKEELEQRQISQKSLAQQMGIPYTALNDILNERRALTTTTALLFEAALGISAEVLMRLQLKYNMQMSRQDATLAQRLANIRKIAAMF